MSNSLAIAAVTTTLRHLIEQGLQTDVSGVAVTTRPPDKARDNGRNSNQINLFLYQTAHNAALRNMDMPSHVKPGETGKPPLALNLYYLITAYAENDDYPDPISHRLLGGAMSVFHDHPLLSSDDIKAALPLADLPDYDLYNQVERVRITPQSLSLDEMSKLWTTFQTQYRISAAYQVSVVLIESTRPTKAPLPVLTRGPKDWGVTAQADLTPPYPMLTAVNPPKQQPSVRLGEVLTIRGHNLDGDNVIIRFMNPRLTDPVSTQLLEKTATEITVKLLDAADNPEAPAKWLTGLYTVAVIISRSGEPERTTNELPFLLAPRLDIPSDSVRRDAISNDVTLSLKCSPQVWSEQRVALLLGDREILAQPHPVKTDTLEFNVTGVPSGKYLCRLRVDGIDSLLVKDYSAKPPVFDESQEVTIP